MQSIKNMRIFWVTVPALLLLSSLPAESQPIVAGVAKGFPPYQYQEKGRPAGLDVELAEAIAKEAGVSLVWTQEAWDELTSLLRLTTKLDMLTGMEKTGDREQYYLFTQTLYVRRNVLFVLDWNSGITKLKDLSGMTVARDRDAFSDELLVSSGLKDAVRLVRTESKEESFAALVAGKVAAVFMPESVGWALAQAARVAVRAIDLGDPGSPVGLAFRRDLSALAARMNVAALQLERRGGLKKILEKYRFTRGSVGTP